MSNNRYINRAKIDNVNPLYKKQMEDRGLRFIRHYTTPIMRYPTDKEKESLLPIGHIWKTGDRYYKLAHKHYGDSRYWWVIAWFNRKPTESHLSLGDSVYIPTPLDKVLEFLGY